MIVCIKEPHRQVGVGVVVTSEALGGVKVSTLGQNASHLGSSLIFAAIFTLFITSMTLVP